MSRRKKKIGRNRKKKTERIIKIKPRKIQYNILIIKNNKKLLYPYL